MTGKIRLDPENGKATLTLTSAGPNEAALMDGFYRAATAKGEELPDGVKVEFTIGLERRLNWRRRPVGRSEYGMRHRDKLEAQGILEFVLQLEGEDGKPMPMLPAPSTPALEGT